jgi:hypothetical protein
MRCIGTRGSECEPRRAKLKPEMEDYDVATGRVRALHAVVVSIAILIIIAIASFGLAEAAIKLAL